MRRVVIWFSLTSLVLMALLVQATAFLLDMVDAAPAAVSDGERFGAPGPHLVGIDELTTDGATPLDTVVWYPAEPSAGPRATYSFDLALFGPVGRFSLGTYQGRAVRRAPSDDGPGPFPVVVLSPGFALSSSSYAWLGEHLASHGFVVISPDHGEELNPSGLGVAAVARPDDIRAVLDHVEQEGRFAHLLDMDRVAVVGHSLGGFTALAVGGARLDTAALEERCEVAYGEQNPSAWLCDALLPQVEQTAAAAGLEKVPAGLWPTMRDPRVDAVVSMAGDAFLFDREGLAEVEVPMLAIGGTDDRDSPFEWTTQLAYDEVSSEMKAIVALPDAGHMIFVNECETTRRVIQIAPNDFCFDDHWDRAEAHRMIAHRMTAFLLEALIDQ